jgi:hypothetical protein
LDVLVIKTSSRVLGQEHLDTLTSMANLASTYQNQGRGIEALKLIEECVILRTRTIGTNHPNNLSSRIVLLR